MRWGGVILVGRVIWVTFDFYYFLPKHLVSLKPATHRYELNQSLKKLFGPFLWMGFNCHKTEPIQGGGLLFQPLALWWNISYFLFLDIIKAGKTVSAETQKLLWSCTIKKCTLNFACEGELNYQIKNIL